MRARLVAFSVAAEADIDAIAAYTKKRWGADQADAYLTKLEEAFDSLAKVPAAGRNCDFLWPEMRRFEVESHVIFYRVEESHIQVIRVLHRRMLPVRSRFEP